MDIFSLPYEDVQRIFHDVPRHIADQLWFTDEALYSVTPTDQAEFTYEIIKRYLPQVGSLTDAGGGFGGNVLTFARHIPIVNYIDIKSADIFEHNYSLLKTPQHGKINIYRADYSQIYDQLEQDVVFMDPPWGGPEYRREKNLKLYYSQTDVAEIVRRLYLGSKTKLILIKAPFNYYLRARDIGIENARIETIPLMRPDSKMLYKIVIVARHGPRFRQYPRFRVFPPLGYKSFGERKPVSDTN